MPISDPIQRNETLEAHCDSGQPECPDGNGRAVAPADAQAAVAEQNEAPSASQDTGASEVGPAADPTAALQAKVTELEDALLRARADFQNFQRRSAAERSDAVRYANAELVRSLLVVVDDLERTLDAVEKGADAAALSDGVRIAYEHFIKVLKDFGVEPIEALHRPFDPSVHSALMRRPSNEHAPGTVVEQMTKGFRLRDRVLRPASVAVSSGESEPRPPVLDAERQG
jgi:molecular chaperone GrpE